MSNRKSLVEVERIKEGSRKPAKIVYRTASRDGRIVRLRLIDAEGADFTEQLTDSFRSNVRKARAENREISETH